MQDMHDHGFLDELMVSLVKNYCERWEVSEFEGVLATRIFEEEAFVEVLSTIYEYPVFHDDPSIQLTQGAVEKLDFQEARDLLCFPLEGPQGIYGLWLANPAHPRVKDILPGVQRFIGTKQEILKSICECYPVDEELLGVEKKECC